MSAPGSRPARGRLVYVIGPSGAGKDSVLGWLRQQIAPNPSVHWARRTITRMAAPGGEAHEAIDAPQFLALRERGAFALDWQAHGLHYGVRRGEMEPLERNRWVFVNGSRGHLDATRQRFPGLAAVHISASPETLHRRLLARGRECAQDVQVRIERSRSLPPAQAFEILNDGALEDAGRQLLQHLQTLPGWPA